MKDYRWQHFTEKKNVILADLEKCNNSFFDNEVGKLDNWVDDLKNNLEKEIKNLDKEINETKKKREK